MTPSKAGRAWNAATLAAVQFIKGRKMQLMPAKQRHLYRRRGFHRPVAPALAVGDKTDNFVFQQFLEKRRRRVTARQAVTLHDFKEPLGKQPSALFIGFVAKILSQRRVRHQPALVRPEQRGHPRTGLVHR
ncbi:MAG: hypothetical protein C0480_11485 [Bradyrhizobium sp.]|nr:hypothetical protein [Bradyrhizobium sp.]